MTRILAFEGPRAKRRFELLWTSLAAGGDGKGDRTPVVIRKEARLQTQFEGISDAASTNGNPGMPSRILNGEPSVTLSQEDFELLSQYAEKTPWTPLVSRDVVDLWDWLSAAEKRD